MTWEAVTALATLASAIVVAVAAIAAVVQIRHLRSGNQLEATLHIYDTFNGREMLAARAYCLYEFPDALEREGALAEILEGKLDLRVTLVANFHNTIGALVVDGFLDERLMWPLIPITARLWGILAPLAAALRRTRDDPVWADFEFLASLQERLTRGTYIGRYPPSFQRRLRAELAELTSSDD